MFIGCMQDKTGSQQVTRLTSTTEAMSYLQGQYQARLYRLVRLMVCPPAMASHQFQARLRADRVLI